jgi:hypothetical protein
VLGGLIEPHHVYVDVYVFLRLEHDHDHARAHACVNAHVNARVSARVNARAHVHAHLYGNDGGVHDAEDLALAGALAEPASQLLVFLFSQRRHEAHSVGSVNLAFQLHIQSIL